MKEEASMLEQTRVSLLYPAGIFNEERVLWKPFNVNSEKRPV